MIAIPLAFAIIHFVAIVFAARWSFTAWGIPGGFGVLVLMVLLFAVPTGSMWGWLVAGAIVGAAQKVRFAQIAAGA